MKLKDLLPFLAENQKDFKAHFAIGGGIAKTPNYL